MKGHENPDTWDRIQADAKVLPLHVIEARLLARGPYGMYPGGPLDAALTARVMTDAHWVYRHPVDSVRLAWRFRA